jgi:hypothetical protein
VSRINPTRRHQRLLYELAADDFIADFAIQNGLRSLEVSAEPLGLITQPERLRD